MENLGLMNELIPRPDLVCRFMFVFSRFEYALKPEGYVLGDSRGVKADWGRFAVELPDLRHCADETVSMAAALLSESPPLKQVITNGRLAWKSGVAGLKNNVGLLGF